LSPAAAFFPASEAHQASKIGKFTDGGNFWGSGLHPLHPGDSGRRAAPDRGI
jgi:hypothetical protein